ncbi:MAG: hypothetical protein LC104_08235, partial [Bacteroidales bacterium]|nr:hypothetical protein [Bacteroidales bacterium]
MKQLYAVGPLPASDAPGQSGSVAVPTLRAASLGIDSGELATLLPYLGYAPPPGYPADAATPLPTRMVLLQLGHLGRVLAHVHPHAGQFFTHAILDVPPSADAHLVIQTWASPAWEREESGSSGSLSDMPYLPVADALSDAVIQDWLSTPVSRDLLEFVLSALLSTEPGTRIFVATGAEDLARLVYAVTRALPPGMLDEFTFSTYEPDPLASVARLTGFDSGSVDWDLPDTCYTEAGVAFNPATGRRSLLADDVPFANFAVTALATGEFGPLDEFKATWQRLGMSGLRQFDLVFRLARGSGILTKEETAEALQYPPLTAWVSARTDALNQFLEWAVDDRRFAQDSFSRVAQSLRQKPDILAKLGQTVRETGLKALRDGDCQKAANALEVILPMVAPAKAGTIWGELLTQVTDPDTLSWEMRWYLLPRFVKFKQQQTGRGETAPDPALVKWLDVPAAHLGEALALDLPKPYHIAAGRACLKRDGEPSSELVQTLAAHPQLTLTLLQPGDTPTARLVQLYEALLADAPSIGWLERILAKADQYPANLLNTYFESTLAAGKVDADRIIRTQGARLFDLFSGKSGLDRLGRQFLAVPPPDVLHGSVLLDFLRRLLAEIGVSDEVKLRARSILAVRVYLDDPSFSVDAIQPAAEAFTVSPPVLPPSAKDELFTLVGDELLKRASSSELQADLESALLHFGPVLAHDPVDLYENLLRDLRGRTDFARNTN